MKTTKLSIWTLCILFTGLSLASCSDDDVPEPENEEEEIAVVALTFTPTTTGGTPLTFTWTDPDGEGPQQPSIEPIQLAANTSYTLTMQLFSPTGENIGEEIEAEADEHMFFFGWTPADLFTSPAGDGNIDNRTDPVNYSDRDRDVNGQPLGLETQWTTGAAANGTFRIVLKHQPGLKSATSDVNTGATDLDIDAWPISIQ